MTPCQQRFGLYLLTLIATIVCPLSAQEILSPAINQARVPDANLIPQVDPNTPASSPLLMSGIASENQEPVLQTPKFTVRIKDITTIEGHRSNRLEGFGLITGLKGTGGRGAVTEQFVRTMLQNYGILAAQIPTKSLSVVSVSAEVPPFYKPGETLIATVSVLDDATSLYGGQLLRTPLTGIDGQVYALAGGPLEIGGFSVSGAAGSVRKNHDTVGKVQAQLEVSLGGEPAFNSNQLRLLLRNKDYTTAYRIASEINKFFPKHARANDSGSVDVAIPRTFAQSPIDFVVMINNLRVEPDSPARVIINEKTGTIVIGKNVRLTSVMFAKDNLIITTNELPIVSQPAPFGQGETVVLPRTQIETLQEGGRYNVLPAASTVGDLAGMLNLLGVPPQDIISVFLSLQAEGSLQAELVIQ